MPGGTITYTTDARDRRVGKSVSGVLTQGFLYGDQLNPVAELDGSGAVVSVFVYGVASNVPDYMVQGSDTYRFVVDHLGSVVAVVDSTTGVIVQQREYDAFGRIVSETTAPGFSQPFGFAGGLWDADTGMIRFGARDYRPDIGSWVSKDPLRFGGGDTSLYAYAANDPVNLWDLNGLMIGATSVERSCGVSMALCTAAGVTRVGGASARIARAGGLGALGGTGSLAVNSGGTLICEYSGELVRIGRAAFDGLSRAPEFGIRAYKELAGKALKGTGLQAHHLIERRFAEVMGQNPRDMLSVPVTAGAGSEHQAFTNAWARAFPTGQGLAGVSPQALLNAAAEIYADHLEILVALGLL